jgi:site-specific DNA recombinase
MPSAVIYARKSTESEERQVQSIDSQIRLNEGMLQSLDIPAAAVFQESKSAKEPYQRLVFEEVLKLIEKGKVDTLIAYHPDRLSRNEIDAARICYLVRKGKLNLYFQSYHFTNSPEGIMMLQMALSQSQYQVSKLSVDVRRGINDKLAAGVPPHYAPPGYRNNVENHTLDPDISGNRFNLIREFMQMVMTGLYSVPQALSILNDEWGFRTRPTKNRPSIPLSRSSAYKLLANKFYTGYFEHMGKTYKGNYTPMITVGEFARLQEVVSGLEKQKRVRKEFSYTGLIRCANCGCMVTAEDSKGHMKVRSYTYYHCTNKRGSCNMKGIREETLEKDINERLSNFEIDEYVVSKARKALANWQKLNAESTENVYEQSHQALEDARRRYNKLINMGLDELIPQPVFKEKEKSLSDEITRLEEAVADTEAEFEKINRNALKAAAFSRHAPKLFLVGTLQEKREIAKSLGIEYSYNNGNIDINIHPAIVGLPFLIEKFQSDSDNFLPPENGRLEPQKTGSPILKKTFSDEKVSFGWG